MIWHASVFADLTTDHVGNANLNMEHLREHFKNDAVFGKLAPERILFLEGVVIPLLGNYMLPQPYGKAIWKFFDTKVDIAVGSKKLELAWVKRLKTIEVREMFIAIPQDFTWSQATLTPSILVDILGAFEKLEIPYFAETKIDAVFISLLPRLHAEIQDNAASVNLLKEQMNMDSKTPGILNFNDLTPKNWILHPTEGWVEVESVDQSDGGTLKVFFESRFLGESRTIRKLVGQKGLVFAQERSQAADFLISRRASQSFPFEHIAMVLAHSILYDRVVKRKNDNLIPFFGALDPHSENLRHFLVELKNKILHRGLGYDTDYSKELTILLNAAQALFTATGEDIVQSGTLKTIENNYGASGWQFHKGFANDVFPSNADAKGAKQLTKIHNDIFQFLLSLAWKRGLHALDKNSKIDASLGFLTVLGTFYPPDHKKHNTDPATLAIRALQEFSSYDVASEIIHAYRDKILRHFKPDSADIVAFVPERNYLDQMASRLLAEAFVREFCPGGSVTKILGITGELTFHKYFNPMSAKLFEGREMFAVSERAVEKIRGRRVILVDDIGSENQAADLRRLLLDAGAREVRLVLVTKTDGSTLKSDLRSGASDDSWISLLEALEKDQGIRGTEKLVRGFKKFRSSNELDDTQETKKKFYAAVIKTNVEDKIEDAILKIKNTYFEKILQTKDINSLSEDDWLDFYRAAANEAPDKFLEAMFSALWEQGIILQMNEKALFGLQSAVQIIVESNNAVPKVVFWSKRFLEGLESCRGYNSLKYEQNVTPEVRGFISEILILQQTRGGSSVDEFFKETFGNATATSKRDIEKKLSVLDEKQRLIFEAFLRLDFSQKFLPSEARIGYFVGLKTVQKKLGEAESWILEKIERMELNNGSAKDFEAYLFQLKKFKKTSVKTQKRLQVLIGKFEAAGYTACANDCACVISKSGKN